MSKIEIRIGDYNTTTKAFDPEVQVTIHGEHALAKEVMEYLEKFESESIIVAVR